ncbi:MAG: helix-turn-helix domain-containing protein [Gammaproteobacteria bacterium]|nr:helix-turn-helix domain-containing protein [Gammaproteobacteria bacterium]
MAGPQAATITLSESQQEILERLLRRDKTPQALVQRIHIVLCAAQGLSNAQIARRLQHQRRTVIRWRGRWAQAMAGLATAEAEQVSAKQLEALVVQVFADAARPGAPVKFAAEQVAQIVAVACEAPAESACPVTHWTPQELRLEVLKRGIVEEISARSVGRFLKGERAQAASESLLAEQPAD